MDNNISMIKRDYVTLQAFLELSSSLSLSLAQDSSKHFPKKRIKFATLLRLNLSLEVVEEGCERAKVKS